MSHAGVYFSSGETVRFCRSAALINGIFETLALRLAGEQSTTAFTASV